MHQDVKINTAKVIEMDTTKFLMDLHNHAKDLHAFLTFNAP